MKNILFFIIISIIFSNCSINTKLTIKSIEDVILIYPSQCPYLLAENNEINVGEEYIELLINELKNSENIYMGGLIIRVNPSIPIYQIKIISHSKNTDILIFNTGSFQINSGKFYYPKNGKDKLFSIIEEIINSSKNNNLINYINTYKYFNI